MAITSNKSLVVLVALNVVSFMVIFWLIGLLMGKQSSPPEQIGNAAPAMVRPQAQTVTPNRTPPQMISAAPVQPAPAPATARAPEPVALSAPAALADVVDRELSEPVTAEPASDVPETVESTVDVYYDGSIVRVEETDEFGNVNVSISNSLRDVKKIASKDVEYLSALKELQSGQRSHMSMQKVSQVDAKKFRAMQKRDSAPVDNFNKVAITDNNDTRTPVSRDAGLLALAEQIESVVAENIEKPGKEDRKYARASVQDYLKSLDKASQERANETRIIRVRPGDSLWKIAARAYGDGFQYPRIFKANPHLTSPDLIRAGDILRVPL